MVPQIFDIIIKLLTGVEQYLNDNGIFIISGIIDIRVEDVLNAIENSPFYIVNRLQKENWYAFVLRLTRVEPVTPDK